MRLGYRIDEGQVLNPGVLRHQITWQSKTITGQNSAGEDIVSWVDVITVKCQVKSLQGREVEATRQRWAEAQFHVKQHYVPGMERIDRGYWLVDGAVQYLDILDIQDPVGTGRFQVIMAKEWVS